MKTSLFRKEVLLNQKFKHLGPVFINTPKFMTGTSWASILILGALVGITIFGTYTEQWAVSGFINASQGVTQTYVKIPSLIQKVYIREGQVVHHGDVLFKLSLEAYRQKQLQRIKISYQRKKLLLQTSIKQKQTYLNRLKPLLEKKYIAASFYQSKEDEIVTIKNQIHSLEMEYLQNEALQTAMVRAPIDGTIVNLMAFKGQFVQPDKPLVSILPKDTDYIAQLYIPVQKAGFIQAHHKVAIQYDAFPYRRFGMAKAVIQTISQSVLTDASEEKPILIKQPYYKAIATLNKSYILAYGKPHYLHQGMTFTAIIEGEKKKLWQWLLDPLLSEQSDENTSF